MQSDVSVIIQSVLKPGRVWFRLCALVCLLHTLTKAPLFAQNSTPDRLQVERVIEELVSELDPEESGQEIAELVELLEDLAANPSNINRANADELAGIPGIDFRIAREIITYREQVNPFEEISQLVEVPGIGEVTYRKIRPFVTTGSGSQLRRDLYLNRRYWTAGGRFDLLSGVQSVVQKQEGYRRSDSQTRYAGTPLKLSNRMRYRSDRLSINLTQEKDPGESLNGFTGFDYTSWHVGVRNAGVLQNLVIGDFRVSYGQGLILWTGGSFGKSSQIRGAAVKNDLGIRPYTSTQETNAFRGVAGTVGKNLQVSGFYSSRPQTASEVNETDVRFPSASGLHRTQNERARRHNLQQETLGGRVRYHFRRGVIGISAYRNQYSRSVQRGAQPYQVHQFSGNTLSATSADFQVSAGPALLFTEAARTDNGGTGLITGSELDFKRQTTLSMAYRRYSADFQSIFGSGFGEQSRTQNEEGFYLGLDQALGEKMSFRGYYDIYRTFAARFRNSRPTTGTDGLARIEFNPHAELTLYAQYRHKKREQETEQEDAFGRSRLHMSHTLRSNVRMQAEYSVHPSLRLRSRLDFVRARQTTSSPTYGMLFFQDARFSPGPDLTLDLRITLFDTDDFSSRVFQFENDLLYVMSNTMLFDQGQRMYAVLRYRPIPSLTIRMKAATTLYENRFEIGSGLDRIRGNRRSDIGLQIQLKL